MLQDRSVLKHRQGQDCSTSFPIKWICPRQTRHTNMDPCTSRVSNCNLRAGCFGEKRAWLHETWVDANGRICGVGLSLETVYSPAFGFYNIAVMWCKESMAQDWAMLWEHGRETVGPCSGDCSTCEWMSWCAVLLVCRGDKLVGVKPRIRKMICSLSYIYTGTLRPLSPGTFSQTICYRTNRWKSFRCVNNEGAHIIPWCLVVLDMRSITVGELQNKERYPG